MEHTMEEFLANQDETIKNDVIQVIGQYTLDEFEANKEQVEVGDFI